MNKEGIWELNKTVPQPVQSLLHGIIEDKATAAPNAPAIQAWDGKLTYLELDTAATNLARRLSKAGVGPEILVPVCFEKSVWAIVSMLAVLKAGGAFVALDPSQPSLRRKKILNQTSGPVVVVSASCSSLFDDDHYQLIIVDSSTFERDQTVNTYSASQVSIKNPAYVIFTSGSTGEPKGVVVEHQAICTSITIRARAQGIGPRSRFLQFASFTFDVMIDEIFMTLSAGGCVCVPNEEDRTDNLTQAIIELDVNTLGLTPTVARLINPNDIPGLETVILWGEALLHADLMRWEKVAHVIGGYGPTECCVVCAIEKFDFRSTYGNGVLGTAIASVLWVVDPYDHNKLAPFGAVGELVVEGPVLARGYLHDSKKTEESFIRDPDWLLYGTETIAGRQGRVYKTGDLVRYNGDGKLYYVGRKDTQVKVNGQRVELGEVESQISQLIPEVTIAVAEVVTFSGGETALSVFIQLAENATSASEPAGEVLTLEPWPVSTQVMNGLAQRLPRHMVPSVFFRIQEIPKNASGKSDRRLLRSTAGALVLRDITKAIASNVKDMQPMSAKEQKLQRIWADVLGLDPLEISLNESFFRLGGDSVDAVKISAQARGHGLQISVPDMLRNPSLGDSAAIAVSTSVKADEESILPFSLLPISVDKAEVCQQAITTYQLGHDLEDLLPCTPLQEGLLSLTDRDPGDYMMQFTLQISDDIAVDKLCSAWASVIKLLPILRTRMLSIPACGILQAVLPDETFWNRGDNLQQYLYSDRAKPMKLGDSLARYAIIHEPGHKRWFVWTLHHSLYDGWSLRRILAIVERAYRGLSLGQPRSFRPFIKYVTSSNRQEAEEFWKRYLDGFGAPQFPAVDSKKNPNKKKGFYETERVVFPDNDRSQSHVPTTFIRAAISIVLSKLTSSDEVVFGTTVFGRHCPIEGIEDIIGPTFATIPVRTKLTMTQTVESFLDTIGEQALAVMPYEQYGLQNIARLGSSCKEACNFQTFVVVQAKEEFFDTGLLGEWQWQDTIVQNHLSTYPLMIQCSTVKRMIKVQVTFDEEIISGVEVKRIIDRFCYVLEQLVQAKPFLQLQDINVMSSSELQEIWELNKTVPQPVQSLLHGIIEDKATAAPNAPAIQAWDGKLTYLELDTAATNLARRLSKAGVGPEILVPVCFEKSVWAIVSMLAVLKAGGAFVALDPSQPSLRRKKILNQTSGPVVVVSASCSSLFDDDHYQLIIVDSSTFERDQTVNTYSASQVSIKNPAYVIFTSGSTGEPKGVVVEHQAICTSITIRARAQGIGPRSRFLQFASFTYDVMIDEIFMTLSAGGCVCVPNEEDRTDNLTQAIMDLQVNTACLTPTVARFLKCNANIGVEIMILGGEAVYLHDVTPWKNIAHVIGGYGPTECCVVCAIEKFDFRSTYGNGVLGTAIASVLWVVDPYDHNKLAPFGAVGELVVEGPVLARGYLHDSKKTEESFIRDPDWLLYGTETIAGRQGRVYKTGDLVRYNGDGKLYYVGRKDTQVKVNGQRVELGEVESQISQLIPEVTIAVAEVVTFSGGETALSVFIQLAENATSASEPAGEVLTLEPWPVSTQVMNGLAQRLPRHMVPSVFFRIQEIPKNASGKSDRRLLRSTAGALVLRDITKAIASNVKDMQPMSAKEQKLQRIWADVLGLDPLEISLNESFFRLGGDSVDAVKISAQARGHGLQISVPDMLRNPSLGDSAAIAVSTSVKADEESILPFSLLPISVDKAEVCQQAITTYQLGHDLEDLLPCTPLQEGLLSLTDRDPGDYMMQFTLQISDDIAVDKLCSAWASVIKLLPILRTRMLSIPACGILQAVLPDETFWNRGDNLQQYLYSDRAKPMKLGDSLARYAIIHEPGHKRWFVWTLHHSLYDGWSLRRILAIVERAYRGLSLGQPRSFRPFIKYVTSSNRQEAEEFWKRYLDGFGAPQFPAVDSKKNPNKKKGFYETERVVFPDNDRSQSHVPTTFIRAAISIVLSKLTSSDEVVFGTTVFGRHCPIEGIEDIIGPTFATIPVRTKLTMTQTVESFLDTIGEQALAVMPYEQYGLQNIARLGSSCKEACNFQTFVVVQAKEEFFDTGLLGEWQWQDTIVQNHLSTYPLMIQCSTVKRMIKVQVTFDEEIISGVEVKRIIDRFCYVLEQLVQAKPFLQLQDINVMSSSELQEIWELNKTVPQPVQSLLHGIIEDKATAAPNAPAIQAWDGKLTYLELDTAATNLARRLSKAGVGPEILVPVCFEKSVWAIVSMLAVLKAGGAFVALDPSQPSLRRKKILNQTSGPVVVVSASCSSLFDDDHYQLIIVDSSTFERDQTVNTYSASQVSIKNPAYVIFTSGSTGEPKGVVVEHQAICTSTTIRARAQGIGPRSRFLQFASFTFDAIIEEIFMTLSAGGCVCVPNEEDRTDNLTQAIIELDVNTLGLTPTVARLINPNDIPGLETVILWGEALLHADLMRWEKVAHVIGGYGPTECCVVCAIEKFDFRSTYGNGVLGTAIASVLWVVDPYDHNKLAPFGAVGELVVEGPVLARGYLHDSKKTEESFIRDPDWLLYGTETIAGRQGRVYKTGDLVRYNGDGKLYYVGRKDTQVKVNGQRVELGEVESQISQLIPEVTIAVAEVVTFSGGETALSVFIQLAENATSASEPAGEVLTLEPWPVSTQVMNGLAQRLPRHMVPSVFFRIQEIPKNASGKSDRRLLRSTAGALVLRDITKAIASNVKDMQPMSAKEQKLQRIWADVLGLDPLEISLNESFFRLGGNSISAMFISAAARRMGWVLSVNVIFDHPTLAAQAARISDKKVTQLGLEIPSPYSLIDQSLKSNIMSLLSGSVYENNVTDILPTTDSQNGMAMESLLNPETAPAYFFLDLPHSIDFDRLQQACNMLPKYLDIFRTVFILFHERVFQIVLRNISIPLRRIHVPSGDFEDIPEAIWDSSDKPKLILPPITFSLIQQPKTGTGLVIGMSHLHYDGVSLPIILRVLSSAYYGETLPHVVPFSAYLLLRLRLHDQSVNYWSKLLEGSRPNQALSKYRSKMFMPLPHKIEDFRITDMPMIPEGITTASFMNAAWAMVLFDITGESDVVFLTVSSGRNSVVRDIDNIVGPCVNFLPIRAKLPDSCSAFDLLRSIQDQLMALGNGDTLGADEILNKCVDWPSGSIFDSNFQHQNAEEHPEHRLAGTSLATKWPNKKLYRSRKTFGLCTYEEGEKLRALAITDSNIMTRVGVSTLLDKFCDAVATLNICIRDDLKITTGKQ